MITEKQAMNDRQAERYDLFSMLMDASMNDIEGEALTNSEVMGTLRSRLTSTPSHPSLTGDIFTFLTAGHEVGVYRFRGVCFVMDCVFIDRQPLIRSVMRLPCLRYIPKNKRPCINRSKQYLRKMACQ
jgi:hypothetical protein